MSEIKKLQYLNTSETQQRGHAEVDIMDGELPLYSLGWATEQNPLQVLDRLVEALNRQEEYPNVVQDEDHSDDPYYEGIVMKTQPRRPRCDSRTVEHVGLPEPLTAEGILEVVTESGLSVAALKLLRVNTENGDIGIEPGLYISVLSQIPVWEWAPFVHETYDRETLSFIEKRTLLQFISRLQQGKIIR